MIHRALKLIRQYHGNSQKVLAEKLGISKSYLSEIESGKKTISMDLLYSYSNEFDIPVSSLVFFSENIGGEKKISNKFRRAVTTKVLNIMEWLIERDKQEEVKI